MAANKLDKSIGLWGLSFNLINIMIGAGIFVLPAIVAAGLGSASFIAYLFCGFLISLVMLCFAEVGSESGLSVSGEVRNPQKTIPRAIFIAVSSVLILYILIQTVALGVLGPSLALHKENPLGEVAKFVLGPAGLTLMIIGAGVSMFGNLSSEILSVPRIVYGAAKDRVIPNSCNCRWSNYLVFGQPVPKRDDLHSYHHCSPERSLFFADS